MCNRKPKLQAHSRNRDMRKPCSIMSKAAQFPGGYSATELLRTSSLRMIASAISFMVLRF